MKRQPTTQQVTWFLDLYRNNQLDLEPPYQRKSVWSSKDRKFFLDTIFRNYPAPPIFIHRTVNDQGYTKYHVVDGKQRLETILSFFESKISMKVEMGRFDKTEMFEDFFASTIVVKNLNEVSLAENFISKYFNIRFKRPQSTNFTHKDSFSFPFDDLRLYVSLKDFETGELASDMYKIVFEIQVKTFLQHAWSIATHDLIYKADKINWAKERIAYQVKASLEHAEVTISGVEELSKISELKKENKEVKKVNQLISLILNHWKPEDLPSDKRRLAQNIIGFIEAIGLSVPDLNVILVLEKQQGRGTLTRNLSPFLIVVQSVFNAKPDKITKYLQNENKRNKQKILITSEMTVPALGEVIESKLIRI